MLTLFEKWLLYMWHSPSDTDEQNVRWRMVLVKVLTYKVLIGAVWKWGGGIDELVGGASSLWRLITCQDIKRGLQHCESRTFHLGGWLQNSLHRCNKLNQLTPTFEFIQACRLLNGNSLVLVLLACPVYRPVIDARRIWIHLLILLPCYRQQGDRQPFTESFIPSFIHSFSAFRHCFDECSLVVWIYLRFHPPRVYIRYASFTARQ